MCFCQRGMRSRANAAYAPVGYQPPVKATNKLWCNQPTPTESQCYAQFLSFSRSSRNTMLVSAQAYPEVEGEEFWTTFDKACPHSMVHGAGFYNVYQSMAYIRDNNMKGDLVECGCALGGVAIFMRLLLQAWGDTERKIHLFDTFVGPPVGSKDIIHGGKELNWNTPIENHRVGTEQNIIDVTGSLDGFNIVERFVEDTLPKTALSELALLRLDTDFYESTKVSSACKGRRHYRRRLRVLSSIPACHR
jgi:hypothetical protein